jgi:hypothetical protein
LSAASIRRAAPAYRLDGLAGHTLSSERDLAGGQHEARPRVGTQSNSAGFGER